MSAGTSTTPAPVQTAGPNLYRFQDHQGTTQITYYPYAFGPIIVGQPRGPKFEYMGEEGSLTFIGNQIESTDSSIGTQLTVTLRPNQGIGAVLLTLLLVYFFVTVAGSVELPSALLPDTRPTYHATKKNVKAVPARAGRHTRVARIGQVPAGYDPLRAAFYVSWDSNSLASLKKHYKDLDLLMPEQLHAVTPDGAITVVDYEQSPYQTV